jgi:hypothetical protein
MVSMHIIGRPCGVKRKMTNKTPCWLWGLHHESGKFHMVELGRWVEAVLLDMDRGVLSSYPGWDSSVVPVRPSKELWFSTKGERSGSPKEYGNQVNDGFCSPTF